MNFLLDYHTHTIASTHAYSTIMENAKAASERGLAVLGITDHGPAMEDSPHELHFMNYRVLPKELFGVKMLYGAELNIVDYQGNLDLCESIWRSMDICIAGYHPIALKPGTRAENTRAMVGAIQNPYVSVLAHPEDGHIPIDFEEVVRQAAQHHVLIEVNNNSLKNADYRLNVRENLTTLLRLCEKHGCGVCVGSDAHCAASVGDFSEAEAFLQSIGFPAQLALNTDPAAFIKHVEAKTKP